MNSPSTLTWTHSDGTDFALSGRIDENADLDRLATEVASEGATFDLAGIERINSVGTRDWMGFLDQLANRAVTLVRCSRAVVEQLNAIANFHRHARVASVMVDLVCEECGTTRAMVVPIPERTREKIPNIPGAKCATCGRPMEPDDVPSRYFQFMRFL